MTNKIPLVVIAGATASGKTSLGIELAKAFDKDALCLLAEILDNKFVVR